MTTRILVARGDPVTDPETARAVDEAVRVLADGGTVVLPTDTVYGLAADAANPTGIAQIFELKQRADRQPLAVLVSDGVQAGVLGELSEPVRRVMAACWPGALTLVVPRRADHAAIDLGGAATSIGLRCPASPLARAVAARVGPIAVSSANRHGAPTPHAAREAAQSLSGTVGLVLDGGPCREQPSTVVDATGAAWRVLRPGPVPLQSVTAAGGASPHDPRRG